MIDKGCDVNSKNKDNWTPLHFAVEAGNFNLVKYLLELGANVDA